MEGEWAKKLYTDKACTGGYVWIVFNSICLIILAVACLSTYLKPASKGLNVGINLTGCIFGAFGTMLYFFIIINPLSGA